jgi:ribosomal protein L11 methyltransferase
VAGAGKGALKASWLRIALEVDPELAEAVSEALARYIPGGVVIESTAVYANAEDEGHAVGPLRVLGYIPNDAQLEERRSQIEQALRYLELIQPLPTASYELIEEQNWMEAWKQHYKPLTIGERLLVLPAWHTAPDGERVAIRIEPGMAFGTGVHPTTQLCLQLLEKIVRPGDSVIDIGCGSAILAVAAMKLGATQAVAVDIDEQALDNARLNAQLNEVEIEIGVGSVSEVRRGDYGLQLADVVLANILAPVLVRLLDDGLGALMAPGGALVLSGVLDEQAETLESALKKHGLKIEAVKKIQDWQAYAVRKA